MVDVLVFHLMRLDGHRLIADPVLRYTYDPRCDVEEGDVWRRIATDGEVTDHRVVVLRTRFGVDGEELHAFMESMCEPVAQQ